MGDRGRTVGRAIAVAAFRLGRARILSQGRQNQWGLHMDWTWGIKERSKVTPKYATWAVSHGAGRVETGVFEGSSGAQDISCFFLLGSMNDTLSLNFLPSG